MIYAIMLCIANVGCHMLGEPVHTYTFDSPEACLAKLPVVLVRGKSVSTDGHLYLSKIEWLECDGKQTWQTVTPKPASSPAAVAGPVAAPAEFYTVTMCLNESACKPVNVEVFFNSYKECVSAMVERLGPGTLQNERRFYMHDDGKGLPYVWFQCDGTAAAMKRRAAGRDSPAE